MMLTKPKPDDGGREDTSTPPALINTVEETTMTTDEDREKELARRLEMLGGAVTSTVNDDEMMEEDLLLEEELEQEPEEEKEDSANNLMSFDPLPITAPAPAPPAPVPVVESKPKPAAVKPNKSALLARIMAAQERAKQAQMKQSSTTTAPPTQQQTAAKLPAPSELTINPEKEKEKMMKALSGIVDVEIEKETKIDDDLKPPPLPPPPQFMAPPTMAPPLNMMAPPTTATMPPPPMMMAPPPAAMAPPPSFDIFEQQQMKEEKNMPPPPMPPPAFCQVENDILGAPHMQAPSAPPPEDSLMDNFDGITPMAPPPTYPGEQEQADDAGMFEFDIDGNPLSPEDRRKMMEEQRAIMEQIQKQATENKASEAAVRANAFETRMMANQTGGMTAPVSTREMTGVATGVESMDLGNIDPAEIEEQRKILEEIEKAQKDKRGSGAGDYQSPSTEAATASNRTVEIGDGKKVALHGQEKTKAAIKDGSAMLVQCMNCDNWMQVTRAASLMFCPICSTVSPVMQEFSAMASEAAKQLEEDRKLAELLQNEENAAASDYPGNRSAAASRSAAPEASSSWWDSQEGNGWWDSLKVSMGVSANPEDTENKRSAEIQISRPPGSMSASQRALHGVSTGESYDNDRQSLIGGGNPPAARVAESKPLFSCVVDSVSNAAAVAAAGVTSYTQGEEEEEVHGIDTTSFLAVPKIGDDRGSSGNYSAIPNDD